MIEGFDKEIDAILRKARGGESAVLNGSHLDADEIAAFAENALPEKAKPLYIKHLADCDRCRRILSSIISLNAEAEEIPAFVVAREIQTAPVLPWYRRLFAFPNLAYSLGALVLVFGGLIGFIALQSGSELNISQVSNKPFESKSAPVANTANNTAATSNATAATNTTPANMQPNSNSATVYSSNSTANIPSNVAAVSNSPAEKSVNSSKERKQQDAPVVAENELSQQPQATPNAESRDENVEEELKTRRVPSPVKKVEPKDDDRALKNQSDEEKPNSASGTTSGETMNVKGKTFNRRNNIWIDSEYRGQSTTNITRGTEDYKKLDQDLRQTVERLGGTVVIVWKTKAYRIQ